MTSIVGVLGSEFGRPNNSHRIFGLYDGLCFFFAELLPLVPRDSIKVVSFGCKGCTITPDGSAEKQTSESSIIARVYISDKGLAESGRIVEAVKPVRRDSEQRMVRDGRRLRLRVRLPDYPGALEGLASMIAEASANIVGTSYTRAHYGVSLNEARSIIR